MHSKIPVRNDELHLFTICIRDVIQVEQKDQKRTKIIQFQFSSDKCSHYFWTNLGPIQVEIIVEHIKYPQCCKSRILEDLTDIVILGPTNAL